MRNMVDFKYAKERVASVQCQYMRHHTLLEQSLQQQTVLSTRSFAVRLEGVCLGDVLESSEGIPVPGGAGALCLRALHTAQKQAQVPCSHCDATAWIFPGCYEAFPSIPLSVLPHPSLSCSPCVRLKGVVMHQQGLDIRCQGCQFACCISWVSLVQTLLCMLCPCLQSVLLCLLLHLVHQALSQAAGKALWC